MKGRHWEVDADFSHQMPGMEIFDKIEIYRNISYAEKRFSKLVKRKTAP